MKNSALFVLCALLTACGGSGDSKTTNKKTIQSYTISTSVKGEGQLQPTSLVLKQGESGTFELQPAQGYQVASVEGCNGTYSNNIYTIGNASQSCQVTAIFEAKAINVTFESDEYISLYADKNDYIYGDTAVINYELSSGYLLDKITGCNGVLGNELYKIDSLTADCQVKATTLPISQTFSREGKEQINVTVLNGAGSILPSSKGIIEPSTPELPALNNSLEFERDLLAVDIATEAGQTIELQITYEAPLPAKFTYQKLIAQQWQALDQDNITVSDDRLTLILTLTDGGAGDSDGVINGVIKDPGGPAVVKMHTVTINQSAGGAITPESLAVAHGDTALFTISTDAGYTLESMTGCNGTLNGTSYQTAAITQNCEISAEFSLTSFLVTAQAGEGGQISPLEQLASYGDILTFTVTADDGHNIESVQGCNGLLSGNTYTTGIINSECEVRATFDPKTVLVTAQAGMGGSISPMSQELNIGQQASLIVTPNEGYSISNVTGCSGSLNGNTYTTSAVTVNCQVQASFSINSYIVTGSAGEGGTVNPATQNVNHGSSAQITITPNEGYSIDAVTGCSGSLSGSTYTTSAVIANCQVQASFSINSYTVSASAGEGGTVNPATQNVNHGSSAQITITPNEGYSIDAVTGCNGSLNGSTYTTSAVTANCQVQASFSINSYTVSASAGEGGAVNPATQSVNHGSSAQIIITPSEGYSIDAVTGCSGSLIGNTYTTGAVTANCQVQASFSIESYTVSASAGEGGTVSPATQSVNHGSTAQIIITPSEGYSIDAVTGCSGSLNGNTYTTSTVTANCQVQASFSLNRYTVTANAGEGGTVSPATQTVNHGSSGQVTITANEGYIIDSATGCDGMLMNDIYETASVTASCNVNVEYKKMIVINVPDKQLEIAIKNELGLSIEEALTEEVMSRLVALDVFGQDIKSLDGLEYAKNLTKLDINMTKIIDLYPLSGLGITTLNADNTIISDIGPLEGLPLEFVSLNNTELEDISPLESLPLKELHLNNSKVSNIEVISSLKSLNFLDLQNTFVVDILPVLNSGIVSNKGSFLVHGCLSLAGYSHNTKVVDALEAAGVLVKAIDKQRFSKENCIDTIAEVTVKASFQYDSKNSSILIRPSVENPFSAYAWQCSVYINLDYQQPREASKIIKNCEVTDEALMKYGGSAASVMVVFEDGLGGKRSTPIHQVTKENRYSMSYDSYDWGQVVLKSRPKLVPNRAALLRVHFTGDNAAQIPNVEAVINSNLKDIFKATSPNEVRREKVHNSLQFSHNIAIPGEYLQPGITIDIVADERIIDTFTPSFSEQSVISMYIVPIEVEGILPVLPELDALKRNLQKFWPLSDIKLKVTAPLLSQAKNPTDLGTLLNELTFYAQSQNESVYYYGYVARDVIDDQFSGLAYGDFTKTAVGADDDDLSELHAHELGHNFGLGHINCGGPLRTDEFYPYDAESIGSVGVGPALPTLLQPEVYKDVMSYCWPKHVSDYNYEKVQDHINSNPPSSFNSEQVKSNPMGIDNHSRLDNVSSGLYIDGIINKEGEVIIYNIIPTNNVKKAKTQQRMQVSTISSTGEVAIAELNLPKVGHGNDLERFFYGYLPVDSLKKIVIATADKEWSFEAEKHTTDKNLESTLKDLVSIGMIGDKVCLSWPDNDYNQASLFYIDEMIQPVLVNATKSGVCKEMRSNKNDGLWKLILRKGLNVEQIEVTNIY